MRIVYIHPEGYQKRYSEVVIPVGMIGVINKLIMMGYDITGINIPLEKRLNNKFSIQNYFENNLYDIYLIDLHWYIFSYNAIEMSKWIKSINRNAIVILGGITATQYKNEIAKDYECVDFIISGDSEVCYEKLFAKLSGKQISYSEIENLTYREGDNVLNNVVRCINNKKFNELSYYNYDWLRNWKSFLKCQAHEEVMENGMESLLAWIPIARGCKYNCSYCGGNTVFFKNYFNYEGYNLRSIDAIVKDMKNLYRQGINKVGVTHDLAIFGDEFWGELFGEIEKSKINLSIFHYCFQLPNQKFIYKFNETFNEERSVIGIPVITGNEEVRRKNGKFFSNEDLFETLDAFTGKKTIVSLYFIDNAIDCGENTFNDTKNLIMELAEKYLGIIRLQIGYGFELLQPSSGVYRGEYINSGIQPEWKNFNDIYFT